MRYWVTLPRLSGTTISDGSDHIQKLPDDNPRAWSVPSFGWHTVESETATDAAEDFASGCTGYAYPMRVLVQVEGEALPRRFKVSQQYNAAEVRA